MHDVFLYGPVLGRADNLAVNAADINCPFPHSLTYTQQSPERICEGFGSEIPAWSTGIIPGSKLVGIYREQERENKGKKQSLSGLHNAEVTTLQSGRD